MTSSQAQPEERHLGAHFELLLKGVRRWAVSLVPQVLKSLVDSICTEIQNSKIQVALRQSITFIRVGQKTKQ